MQIVRTIIWVLLLLALLVFSWANWEPTLTVRIWQGLVIDTKIPAIVIVSFLIGFIPMWLLYRASKWQSKRKIASLENAARTAAATPVVPSQAVEHPPIEQPVVAPTPAPAPVQSELPEDEPPTSLRPQD